MELNNLPLFGIVKRRLDWLTQRQEVLASNIANADTPGHKSRDIAKFKFDELVRREKMNLNMASSDAGHVGGRRKRLRDWASEEIKRPHETLPNENSVVLEEQMGKMNETQVMHKVTTSLYKKQLHLFKIAIGKG